MKKYFVSFTYKKILAGGGITGDLLTFEILQLDTSEMGPDDKTGVRSLSKEGITLALIDKKYNIDYLNIIHVNAL